MNVLSKEQLQDAARCSTHRTCMGCLLDDITESVYDCRQMCAKSALHYMDKCERQAALLKQARAALELIHSDYDGFRHSPKIKRLLQGNTDIMTNMRWTEGLDKAWAAIAEIDGEGN
jgi:hypothetical protein